MKNAFFYKLIIILAAFCFFVPVFFVKAEDIKTSINDYRKIKKNLTVTPTPSQDGTTPTAEDPKKQQLTKIISILIQIINDQKTQISTFQSFDQLQKDQLSQSLQSLTGDLMSKATKVDAADSPEKLKSLADDVLSTWSSGQLGFKKTTYTLLNGKIGDAASRFDAQIKDLQTQYETLKNKNKDVALLLTKINDSQTKLSAIQSNSQQIEQKIGALTKENDLEAGFGDVLNIANQANGSFAALRQSVFDATTEINRLNKDKK